MPRLRPSVTIGACPHVAIIGASNAKEKFGNKAVRAYLRQGWTVYPVNPNEPEVEGLKTYASITDIPGAVDRASLYLPPAVGIDVLDGIKAEGRHATSRSTPAPRAKSSWRRRSALGLNAIWACSIVDIGERP